MLKQRALVIDDSRSARFALSKYLEVRNFSVETAESAEIAFSLLDQDTPDVIFLDHVMPGSDGLDVLETIKNDPRLSSIPVVICSSEGSPDFADRARALGAADVLQKPPSPAALTLILEHLQQMRGQAEHAPTDAAGTAQSPHKVANIRQPEIAIEQAVMKTLRDALPPAPPPPNLAAPNLTLVQARASETQASSITRDLVAEVAQVKSSIARLDARPAALDLQALRDLEARVTRLEQDLLAQTVDVRAYVDAGLQALTERNAEITQVARATAADEANRVAERIVMAAASRIADQLADSILKSLARN